MPRLAICATRFLFRVPRGDLSRSSVREFRVPSSAFHVPVAFRSPLYALCASLLSLTLSGPAEGGSIRITTLVTVSVTGERLHGLVRVTNGGNVPADRVRVDITLPGARIRPAGEETLEVARSADFPFEARLGMLRKGRHPLSVVVHFQDSIGHPFSALSATTFLVQEEKRPDLLAAGEPLVIGDRGTVRFRLENTGALPKTVKASLLLPREFSSTSPTMGSTVPAGSRKEAAFPMANLSALPGAAYPVFCIVEYDLEETHHTVIGMTTVHVAGGENWFRKTRWFWAGGLVLLCAVCWISGILLKKRESD
jgi:hypothetical protein